MHGPSHLFIKTNYIYCRRGILNSRVRAAYLTAATAEFDWVVNEVHQGGQEPRVGPRLLPESSVLSACVSEEERKRETFTGCQETLNFQR